MIRLLRFGPIAALTLIAAGVPVAAVQAADLDSPYLSEGGFQGGEAVVVERPGVAQRYVVLPPVGGPFVYVQGLNGPTGAPVYPLLPFAFGYGY